MNYILFYKLIQYIYIKGFSSLYLSICFFQIFDIRGKYHKNHIYYTLPYTFHLQQILFFGKVIHKYQQSILPRYYYI